MRKNVSNPTPTPNPNNRTTMPTENMSVNMAHNMVPKRHSSSQTSVTIYSSIKSVLYCSDHSGSVIGMGEAK